MAGLASVVAKGPPHVVVAGGGIGGLAFGAAAKARGFRVTVLERSDDVERANVGGGIGLWPPSLAALGLMDGVVPELERHGAWMPAPSYRTAGGATLAEPTSAFPHRFPVLCIHRDRLIRVLLAQCRRTGVDVVAGVGVNGFRVAPSSSSSGAVTVELSDGREVEGDVLVGADGIHSRVRGALLTHNNAAPVAPQPCGYAYFRAVVAVPDNETFWHQCAFESWGEGQRFGFVPLQPPEVFWFGSIPIGTDGLGAKDGSVVATPREKEWLLQRFGHWRMRDGVNIAGLVALTAADQILRTDIHKVPDVLKFRWHGHGGRVVLLGDACHATAPNLAQGAGLSIEDSAELAHQLAVAAPAFPGPQWSRQLAAAARAYEAARKPRAWTVQTMADAVAAVGQLSATPAVLARDAVMRCGTVLVPPVERAVFERVVSHSLGGGGGGNARGLHWLPSPAALRGPGVSDEARQRACLLSRVVGHQAFARLPAHYRAFRAAVHEAGGAGTVTVEGAEGALAKAVARVAGLPSPMADAPFRASVVPSASGATQTWTRCFGEGRAAAVYSTTHGLARCLRPSAPRGVVLTEGIGGRLDGAVRFGYVATCAADEGVVEFRSVGVWVLGRKLPLPSFLLPQSQWKETPTDQGWRFDGRISLPKALGGGCVMAYRGTFDVGHRAPATPAQGGAGEAKTALVFGGTGMIGRRACTALAERGFRTLVVTRQLGNPVLPAGAHGCVWWDGESAEALERHITPHTVIVNLAGENPGAARWTRAVKDRIRGSRVGTIQAIAKAIARAAADGRAPRAFVQASAVGIYGHAEEGVFREDDKDGNSSKDKGRGGGGGAVQAGRAFRARCCEEIEQQALSAVAGTPTRAINLRLGHVLSASGGLLPHLRLAASCCVGRIGSGEQWVPWVHVADAANAIALAGDSALPHSSVLNVVAPAPATNAQLLAALGHPALSSVAMTLPSWVFALLFGESSCVVLDSERCSADKLVQQLDFRFEYPDFRAALESPECRFPRVL